MRRALACLALLTPAVASAQSDAAPALPGDLSIADLSYAPSIAQVGQPITLTVAVRNGGNLAVPASQVCLRWVIDGVETADLSVLAVPDLPPFGSVAVAALMSVVPPASSLEVVAYADCGQVVVEGDELNNRLAVPVVLDGTTMLQMRVQVLPPGTLGQRYEAQLAAMGGTLPHHFTVMGLPPGLTADDGGRVIGVPTQAGDFTGWADVVDGAGARAGAAVEVRILPMADPPRIDVARLPAAIVGVEYCAERVVTLGARGGVPPLVWSALVAPPGLRLSAMGELCGIPDGPPREDLLVVRVQDAVGRTDEVTFRVSIVATDPLVVDASTLGEGVVGEAYEGLVRASGGVTPYAFRVDLGPELPAGLTLDVDGRVHGTPTEAGVRTVSLGALDAAGAFASVTRTIVIRPAVTPSPSPSPTPPSLVEDADPAGCGCGAAGSGSGGIALVLLGCAALLARRRH